MRFFTLLTVAVSAAIALASPMPALPAEDTLSVRDRYSDKYPPCSTFDDSDDDDGPCGVNAYCVEGRRINSSQDRCLGRCGPRLGVPYGPYCGDKISGGGCCFNINN